MTHTTQTTVQETLAVATYPTTVQVIPNALSPVSSLPTNWRSSLSS